MIDALEEQPLDFLVWSFQRDYDPLERAVVEQGIVDPATYSLLNIWSCSGISGRDGAAKPGVTDLWYSAL